MDKRCIISHPTMALRLTMLASFTLRLSMLSGKASQCVAFSSVRQRAHIFPAAVMPSIARWSMPDETQVVQNMLYRIRQVNQVPDDVRRSLLEFKLDGVSLGKVSPNTAKMLCDVDCGGEQVFTIATSDNDGMSAGGDSTASYLTLSESVGSTVESRSEAVEKVMLRLRDDGIVKGWRDETYAISDSFYNEPLLHCERSAVSLLGAVEYGVHINGLVQTNVLEEPRMWIGRRSKTKSKCPGMLDHVVAGGQPSGLGLIENCIKECSEEAGIPEDVAIAGLKPAGLISYETFEPKRERLTRCVLYAFDLYLPETFKPTPVDGEAEEFFLWSIDEVKKSMSPDFHDPIKPNCYVVIIDYLVRTGLVSPEAPGYLDIVRELRSGDCH